MQLRALCCCPVGSRTTSCIQGLMISGFSAPPRMAGTARSPPPQVQGPLGSGVCGLGGMQTAQKLGTEAMPALWWLSKNRPSQRPWRLSKNRPSQRPWPEVTQIPSHTWGERGGMAWGDSAFHLQQHLGGPREQHPPTGS